MNIHLVKAFTRDPEHGNPAGVVIDASELNEQEMQQIASDLGYSESAFVLPSKNADYRVRFFSPKQEVDYCGHATVATYYKLFQLKENTGKKRLTQDTKAGIFIIEKTSSGKIVMQQKPPAFTDVQVSREDVAAMLGSTPDMIHPSLPLQIVATNAANLIVPIVTVEALQALKPNMPALTDYAQHNGNRGVYCFTMSEHTEHNLIARYFNPAAGITEDPATGTAAGPLGCYMDKHFYAGRNPHISISQGVWMGEPSDIYVDLTDGVKVGGYAVEFDPQEYPLTH